MHDVKIRLNLNISYLAVRKTILMKHLFLLLIALVCVSFSCKQPTDNKSFYSTTGFIEGPDLSATPCGGVGYRLAVEGGDPPMVINFLDPLPANSGINLTTDQFPIKVRFNF